ncbi:MAG TPA: sugar ABC transporter ATP-binding protein [Geminicoccus sp.]|uniref:sugar ABC transporter ATP-binding protein n=1 Tax=Geminicoccus sp. TaxID=2024832 RepID=UPI002B78326B|nr:sugar ABC transporter ATP-binding protein [Geminicoccus sp.]HWL71948.1 sugar ABC transporter ATP-binding protein [Geminicoccus sp.]
MTHDPQTGVLTLERPKLVVSNEPPPLFRAEGLTKRYEANTVLSEVGFTVPRNKVVTFVGENGAGKSTLFNILSGIVRPDAGRMWLDGEAYAPQGYGQATAKGVTRVFQEQALIQNVPVYENLLLSEEARFTRLGQFVDRKAMIAAAERMVEEAGLDIDVRRRTGDYDFSKRQSIEIVRACLGPVHLAGIERPFILLDEPTSALDRRDEEAFFRLVEKLKAKGSLLFVSHRLTEVLEISDLIYVLKDGQLVAALDAQEADEATLHGLMVGRERAADFYHERRQRRIDREEVVLRLDRLDLPGIYQDVSLEVRAGEVVGIGGLLDSGKSALGKGAAGVEPPASGSVALAGGAPAEPQIGRFVRAGLGYVPAERLTDGLIAPFSVAWNMTLASGSDLLTSRLGLWRRRHELATADHYVRQLRVRSGTPNLPCTRLSGGNQQKVVLARWLARKPKVLILDNPTRGVDAGAKEEIYALIRDLADEGVGILLITDELLELIGLSNRILIMQRGRVVTEVAAPADAKPGERELVAWMLPGSGGAADALPHAPSQQKIPA